MTPIVEQYNAAIVFQAFGMTASVTVIMLCLGALFPDFFLRIGKVLFFSLLALCAVGFITLIFHMNIGFYSYASAAIFSMYIGYDWAKSNQYVHTLDNAIDSACDIYLDIINLFMDILAILGNGSSKK